MKKQIIFIVGPTGSGKTELSIALAKKIDAEIISADSRQVYKYLNIGTAKASKKQLSEIKHYFVDILEPDEFFSAGKFGNQARAIIDKNIKQNKTTIICGGSGFYIQAILGMIFDNSTTDKKIRENIYKRGEKIGWHYLWEELQKNDPEYAKTFSKNDKKRIARSFEIFEITGKYPTEHFKEQKNQFQYDYLMIGLKCPRNILYERINNRVDKMIENGLVEEVQTILDMGYDTKLNSLNTVGYKEIVKYFNKEYSLSKAITEIKKKTRNYAKRQLTWFRKYSPHFWFEYEKALPKDKMVNKIIDTINRQTKERTTKERYHF
ncbi:MAG: tRNA (adenosine(37)-N6)-dimethylallyltransferase MiaA [Candidatus Marinimicrobia bacterium]|nr:tRNA (adenosine(37)-N6)-dimethylallyltransferase MiaA [Candidatus Neomarinimicrobiota bacterium]